MNWLTVVLLNLILIQFNHAFDTRHNTVVKPRIFKCCPFDQSWLIDTCIINNETENRNFTDIPIYNIHMYEINKHMLDVLEVLPPNGSVILENRIPLPLEGLEDFNIYLLESGVVYFEKKNALYRWEKREPDQYCIDYKISEGSLVPVLLIDFNDLNSEEVQEDENWSRVTIGFMLISVICLLVVLIVYAVLPELRNLGGMILMAYAGSLLLSYVFLAAIKLVTDNGPTAADVCYSITFSIYYLLLSSFFWMNVMSFDIWWTFRGYAKARPIHRRGETFKFCMYALYAWGIPLLMTVATVLLFIADLSHIPWFVKPTLNCFFEEDSKMLYLYVPILILILCNWVFFTLTAYNVWRLSRNTGVLTTAAAGRPSDHHNHRNRLMVYVKLSVVMGMSWVFEVLNYFVPAIRHVHVQDIYHSLIGLVILLIFVFKRKVYNKLLYKFTNLRRLMRESSYSKRYSTSTSDSEMSQDTPLQVCSHPKGVE